MEIFAERRVKLSNLPYRGMVALCLTVALLAGIAATVGVFFRGDGTTATVESVRGEQYEMIATGVYAFNSQRLVSEGVGWDIFTLFVIVPALITALPFLVRGSLRARLFVLGLLAYLFYQYFMYALAWAFGPLFLLFIVIYVAGLAALTWILSTIKVGALNGQFSERFPRRGMAVLSIGLALVLAVMWLDRIAAGLRGELGEAMLLGQTTLVVQALDLGLIVPLAAFTGIMAWKRCPVGYLLSSVLVVKAVAMAAAICAMLISVWVTEGKLDVGPLVLFAGTMAAAAWIGVRMYRSILPAQL
jgi:hypothetical protein